MASVKLITLGSAAGETFNMHMHASLLSPNFLSEDGTRKNQTDTLQVHNEGREDKNRHCQDHEGLSLHNSENHGYLSLL